MATCVHCKTEETQLYVSGIPICVTCADAPPINHKPPTKHKPLTEREISARLLQDMLGAVSRNDEAASEFDHAVSQARTGEPNGAQRIKDAAGKLSLAREEMMAAHNRLNDFVEHGIVPEHLKRST